MNAQLVLENVGMRFPNRVLFEQVNWTLYEGMRVALAGRNGSGKSTVLRILAGQLEPPEGNRTVVGGRRLRIGFLDQSLLDKAAAQADRSLSPLALLKGRLPPDEDESFEDRQWEIRKMLSGLGFSAAWMEGPLHQLSGGWLLRVFIAEALLQKPEVLLLDEPTNHLDLSSIQWLEEFLEREYTGSLILVTHDVALQRRTTDSLAVLHGGRFFFQTHVRDYLSFRDSLVDEKRHLEKAIEGLQKKIEENMDFVRKFRAKAQTAARAQSKLKMAETMTEEQMLLKDRLARVEGNAYNLKFRFRLAGPGGKFPLSAKDLGFRYTESGPWILKNVSMDIKRGQRVAIIGDNGAGKTTLLNVLAERLRPSSGELQKGHAVETGYFGQHQLDELSLDDTVIDNLRSRAKDVGNEELRGWLGAFGFSSQNDLDKKAKVLSGGERARLALLRILITRINVCLLDEPTNHLDIETKELLKTAIREFEGTTVFVSHDREFLSALAERVLYLTQDHQLIDHSGDLDSFFAKYPALVRHVEGRARPSVAPMESRSSKPSSVSYEDKKKLRNQIKSLERKVVQLEGDLSSKGDEKTALQTESLHPDFMSQKSPTERAEVYKRLTLLEQQLHSGMVEWERAASDLESLKKRGG